MIFFLVAGAGAPGLNNFVGETLTLTGMVATQPWVAALGVLGIILGAWYSFRLIQDLLLGQDAPDRNHDSAVLARLDIDAREKSVFGFLAVVCLLIGIYPQMAIHVIQRDAQHLSEVGSKAENSRLALNSSEQKP